jgi:predicted ATP-grasp superfamily ATP-dependent carboligase
LTRVLVTDAGRGSAISVIRSLGRRGVEVLAAASNRLSPGFFSRYAAGRIIYPDPVTHADEAVDALLRAASRRSVDLVVPVGEDIVLLLSKNRERFAQTARLALPDADALEVTRDKLATLDLAKRLDVPVPGTALVATASDALRHARDLGWPVVLKPQASRVVREDGRAVDFFGVSYAADESALMAEMRSFEGRCSVLLQEYCNGEGCGIGALMSRGKPLLAFQHRRLREVPFTGGPSSFRESVPLDPTLFDYAMRLLGALQWTGPAMVEFKLTSDGAKLMEINGRIWGSLPLAVMSGVDLPGRLVELYQADPAETGAGNSQPMMAGPTTAYAVGVRSRYLLLELSWIASVLRARPRYPFLGSPPRRRALVAALRLLDPRDGFDVLSLDDPGPGILEILNVLGKVARRLTLTDRRSD